MLFQHNKFKKGEKKLEIKILPNEQSSHAVIRITYDNGDIFILHHVKNIPLVLRQNDTTSLKSLEVWKVGDYLVNIKERSVALQEGKCFSAVTKPEFKKVKTFDGYTSHK